MLKQFEIIDATLNLPSGSVASMIIDLNPSPETITALAKIGIKTDKNGIISKDTIHLWKRLAIENGLDKRYWKDKEQINEDQSDLIDDL